MTKEEKQQLKAMGLSKKQITDITPLIKDLREYKKISVLDIGKCLGNCNISPKKA